MKPAILLILVLCSANSRAQTGAVADRTSADLVFEGTVLRIGPSSSRVSGRSAVYQLVKYRVTRVCEGSYFESEIVVDHLILSHNQLKGVKKGDKVCVGVNNSDEIFERTTAKGIRKSSDLVPIFHIGGTVKAVSETPCSCPSGVFESKEDRARAQVFRTSSHKK